MAEAAAGVPCEEDEGVVAAFFEEDAAAAAAAAAANGVATDGSDIGVDARASCSRVGVGALWREGAAAARWAAFVLLGAGNALPVSATPCLPSERLGEAVESQAEDVNEGGTATDVSTVRPDRELIV